MSSRVLNLLPTASTTANLETFDAFGRVEHLVNIAAAGPIGAKGDFYQVYGPAESKYVQDILCQVALTGLILTGNAGQMHVPEVPSETQRYVVASNIGLFGTSVNNAPIGGSLADGLGSTPESIRPNADYLTPDQHVAFIRTASRPAGESVELAFDPDDFPIN